MLHIEEIKKALGVSGISTEVSSGSMNASPGVQIDIVLDRKDGVINLFEVKFSEALYTISKKYLMDLLHKKEIFKIETQTNKSIFLSTLTTYGVKQNEQSSMLQYNLSLHDLFL